MTDETKQYDDAENAAQNAGDLGEEFRRFGKQLGDTVTAAWESEGGRQIRTQVGDALREMAQQLDAVSKTVTSRDETQKLREQAGHIVDSVRRSDIAEDLHEGLLTGLKELNQALEQTINRLSREDEGQSNDTPGDDTPGDDTPGDDTPGDDTPGDDTPAA
jgi:uncharacterized membrane protein YccC